MYAVKQVHTEEVVLEEKLNTGDVLATSAADSPPKRAYRGGMRLEQKQQTQARVLDAALRFFGDFGYEAASLRLIAEQAGVSHGVVRLHYGSKDELWKEAVRFLFARQFEEMLVQLDSPVMVKDPRDGVEQLIRSYVAYCARHPEHIRIMVREAIGGGERLEWMAREFIAPLHARAEIRFREAVKAGVLPDLPLVSLLYIVVGAVQSMSLLASEVQAIHGVDAMHPAVVAKHADAVVAAILRPAAESAM